MSDGKTLFHADHGNLAETGAALSIGSLSVARTAMRRQKGLAGEAIRVDPALLIVPPELETQAERLVAEISAASADDVNPFQQKLTVLADANLTDPAAWYIAALPGRPDALQHAYLDGASGPQIFTRDGFETDASEFKVRLDFGAGFVDHRAWYKNSGA
nr:Mu-like prophage major head subunit gpT family protein [Rhodovulum sulfidophilum]